MGRPVCRADYDQDAYGTPFDDGGWTGWQARAALAQPSQAPTEGFTHFPELLESVQQMDAMLKANSAQAEAERPEVVAWRYGFSGGIVSDKACLDEWKSGGEYQSLMTVAQHERIVKAWIERWKAYIELSAKIAAQRDAANARLHEVATACATAEQERDAALARVAELTATRNRYGVDAHYFNKNLQRILRDFESFTPDELARSLIILAKAADEKVVAQAQQLHDLDKQCRDDVARALGLRPSQERGFAWSYLLASIKSCVEASEDAAQAQHSVPEGWMLVECGIWTQEQVDEMQKTVARFRNSEFVDDRALAMAVADAGQCKAPEISLAELLAAAPGKAQHSVPEEFIGRLSEFLAQRGATGKALLRELRDMLAAAPGKEGL
ncbi:hypothetical protein V527_01805 [Pseudomonas aeruginosa VRFPA06]|nr:hypothetical protein V527_01805 [Pseudomonas aeruginosa VRFPA06]